MTGTTVAKIGVVIAATLNMMMSMMMKSSKGMKMGSCLTMTTMETKQRMLLVRQMVTTCLEPN